MAILRSRDPVPANGVDPTSDSDEHEVIEGEEEVEEEEMEEIENRSDALDYEQEREKRIKENKERMKKLGIFDMSMQLKSAIQSSKRGRKRRAFSSSDTPVKEADLIPRSTRRSSRLQNVTPVTYTEVEVERKGKGRRNEIMLDLGSRPEVYTEEHEKLLGECNMSWTLFVDGYGNDGKRIYDPVRGKTCHQCRQKTLGHRTTCSNCDLVQGQFCGDCLYMRYGEHVLEANQNPNWICPPCRGICNCSLCRQAKGWAPTGPLYRKMAKLGYKSVAHYLIQTYRSKTDGGNYLSTAATKGSSPLSNDSPSEETDTSKVSGKDKFKNDSESDPKLEVEIHGLEKDHSLVDDLALEVCNKKEQKIDTYVGVQENGTNTKNLDTIVVAVGTVTTDDKHKQAKVEEDDSLSAKFSGAECQNDKETCGQEKILSITTPAKTSVRKRRCSIIEPSADSIAGRLRQRRKVVES